jgi:uncharacterized DUF497 family protein
MPRLEFDPVKNGSNLRKHGISLDRFGDMDFDAALVAEDVAHSAATERAGSMWGRSMARYTSGSSPTEAQ